MSTDLHIVTPDLPNVFDNAQMNDAYFLIKQLSEKNINIHLHYFTNYSTSPSAQLGELCSSIDVYERDLTKISCRLDLPYHVSTRSSKQLIDRLNKDQSPVLFIGLASTFAIYSKQLKPNRKIAIRINKDEVAYYSQLSTLVPWKGKKLHYQLESWRMSNYLSQLKGRKISFFTNDAQYINKTNSGISYRFMQHLPLFTGLPPIFYQSGKGNFCLFHGKLSNEETAYAANWLLEQVFNQLALPFVIAGSHPSAQLESAAHVRQHTCLVANPGDREMQELIKKAQIILSPAFIEEKEDNLYQSLALGRHILINPKKTSDSQLQSVCHVAHSHKAFIEQTQQLFETAFSEEEKYARQPLLNNTCFDDSSSTILISWLN